MRKWFLRIVLLTMLSFIFLAYEYVVYDDALYFMRPTLDIETILITQDKDQDGKTDMEEYVRGARLEVSNRTTYHSAYYEGGYPPDSEGVCSDVIWRALREAGYDLKSAMDKDIALYLNDYPRIDKPDPNIDFRRVKNQHVFFRKYAESLTTEIVPYDSEIMSQWQPGDIVILKKPDHIAIVSDKRRKDGIPFIIHNSWIRPHEENMLYKWYQEGHIIGHYRYYPQLDN